MRRFVPHLAACLLMAGCSALPLTGDRQEVYDLQRQAWAAYEDDDAAKAENLLRALLRVSPNDAPTWLYLGNIYARTDRPEEAVEAYQKSLMLNGADPRAWHNLGVIRLRQARASFIQAHDLATPEDPLHGRLETVIGAMEQIPLDAMRRKPGEADRGGARKAAGQ